MRKYEMNPIEHVAYGTCWLRGTAKTISDLVDGFYASYFFLIKSRMLIYFIQVESDEQDCGYIVERGKPSSL